MKLHKPTRTSLKAKLCNQFRDGGHNQDQERHNMNLSPHANYSCKPIKNTTDLTENKLQDTHKAVLYGTTEWVPTSTDSVASV